VLDQSPVRSGGTPADAIHETELGGGLRPPSEASPQESIAPAKPALEARGREGGVSDTLGGAWWPCS